LEEGCASASVFHIGLVSKTSGKRPNADEYDGEF